MPEKFTYRKAMTYIKKENISDYARRMLEITKAINIAENIMQNNE